LKGAGKNSPLDRQTTKGHSILRGSGIPSMITFQREGKNRVLHVEQWLPALLPQVFDFFADAMKLEAITPAWLHFQVLTPQPIEIQQGSLIDYKLRLHGIPIRWRSEISVWEPTGRFVDRQVRGPYRLWRHEHLFTEHEGGTLVVDHIDYRVPGGSLAHWLLVEPDLRRIFEFRRHKLTELFAPADDGTLSESAGFIRS
jgi:ligand-binding SRPBCC domain-containing protein